jgi:hypothetical protein
MLLLLQVAAALLASGPGDTTQLPDLSPRPNEPLAELRWEPAVAAPADTGRPRAIEYSNAYGVRLTIHRYASYTMLPLFVAEYVAGRDLFNNNTEASSFARNWHRPLRPPSVDSSSSTPSPACGTSGTAGTTPRAAPDASSTVSSC